MGFRRCAEVTRSLHERTYEDYLELGILTAVDWNFSERDIGSSKKLLLPEPLQASNESRILDMMPPSSIKAYLLSWYLPRNELLMSDRTVGSSFSAEWLNMLKAATASPTPDSECRSIAVAAMNTSAAQNASKNQQCIRTSWRAPLPAHTPTKYVQFQRAEASYWDSRIREVESSTTPQSTALVFDCSPLAAHVTQKLVLELQSKLPGGLKNRPVILIGDTENASKVLPFLDAAAVVSPCSPLSRVGIGSLQSVSVGYVRGDADVKKSAEGCMYAALHYLKEKQVSYIITRLGATDRLVAALASEACRIAALHVPIETIDGAAKNMLGMVVGPFELMDFYGTERVLRMVSHSPTTLPSENSPSVVINALTQMKDSGFLGNGSRRGGFYIPDEVGLFAVNQQVYRTFLSKKPEVDEVADRLQFALIRECCEMLMDGTLASAADANLLSVAIGFPESRGGVLACADEMGIDRSLEKMNGLARAFGASLRPNQLLSSMATNKQNFSGLTSSAIEVSRKIQKLTLHQSQKK